MKSEYEIVQDEFGKNTVYIGDAVYVSHDGYQFWLATTNGIQITNRIALEPAVLKLFLDYTIEMGEFQKIM
jgi:hypothetical protein